MARPTQRTPRGRTVLAIALLLATGISVSSVVRQAEAADDIDLLREGGGNPYVIVLLDTSASMALSPPVVEEPKGNQKSDLGDLMAANADDPGSKLFQVKKALYEVFSTVENVSFGFAEFNSDHGRVLRKHWLYAPQESAELLAGFTYPVATPDDPDDPDVPSDRDRLETMWVFGDPPGTTEAGTCESPIEFSTDDRVNTDIQLNRFPKNILPTQTVRQWIEVSRQTYLMKVSAQSGELGDPAIDVLVELETVVTCSPLVTAPVDEAVVAFRRVTDFLMVEADTTAESDPGVASALANMSNNENALVCDEEETVAGFLDLQDIAADGTCGTESGPFEGQGMEGNNDSGARTDPPHDRNDPNLDRFCWPDDSSNTCYNLRFPTRIDPRFPELDSGDFLPLNWEVDHREEFLKRINPRHPEYVPTRFWDGEGTDDLPNDHPAFQTYLGIARFFRDTPDAEAGILRLKNEGQKPILAFGHSPWTQAANDIRCWYNSESANRCSRNPEPFPDGFEALFREHDDFFKCRIPYFITITDSEDNGVQANNFAADYNDLDNDHGMRNWIFSFQDRSEFTRLENNANTTVVLISDGDQLKEELQEVIGEITQATRTFATAAVPSIQTAAENQIYLTKFQPLNDAGVWEGHLHAFRRPMPQDIVDPPNRDYPNWIWDAGLEMLEQSSQPASDGDNSGVPLKIGDSANQRRVLWTREAVPGLTDQVASPAVHELFDRTAAPAEDPENEEEQDPASDLERDFWDGLEIPYDPADPTSIEEARARANRIVEETLLQKQSPINSDTDDLDWYILGETFHANPLIIGSPVNTRYFIEDAEETFNDGTENGTGYREFFSRHEARRKVVIAGANDGMLHAFDAGRASVDTGADPPEVEFGVGSGREIFAFIPRKVLPTVKHQAENAETHRWSVDGTPAAGDVFIDPKHDGTPVPGDREWRTVLVGGLREGGSGYFALDLTHPDPLTKGTIGPEGAQRDVLVPTDPDRIVPPCYLAEGDGDLGCDDELLYPAPLWEFSDRVWNKSLKQWVPLDEEHVNQDGDPDGNGFVDLAETWSTPNIGRIKVVEGGEEVNKYVAVFGGGLDPAKAGSRGNWLYIVDIETGRAIYKRQLEGSAPSQPAAVDIDQDGFFDRVYLGTTAGFMYRLDLVVEDADGDVVFPALETQDNVCGIDGICNYQVTRFETGSDLANPLWSPKKIFDAADRPIYFPPAVVFVADLGEFALAFGTGDRDDLTAKAPAGSGRFFVFVDETDQLAEADLPMTEANLEQIDREEGDNSNLLTDPTLPVGGKGWFLVLEDSERMIGDPFAFSGITFFASFEPSIEASCSVKCDNNQDDECTECGSGQDPECELLGTSRIYLVGTTDADAFLEDASGNLTRSFDIEGVFVTSPFTEQAVASTPSGEGSEGGEGEGVEGDPLTEAEEEVMQKLMQLFPSQCKFGNHRIDVKVVRADSKLQRIAGVPICIVEKNWKEISQ